MRILITGGHGFIGSHLARELRRHEVTTVDLPHGNFAEPYVARRIIEAAKPEYVVHLAARYGRLLCRDEPHRAVTDNASATTEIASVCAERGTPILYASSSEVYGDHGTETITEDSELRMPTTIYGLSKRWGEEALRLYMPDELLCVPRFNMLYGPDQRAGYGCCALAQFIRKAIDGEPFTVHRGATRSWLYISDAVRAIRGLIEGDHTGVWHIGNAYDRRGMEELADLVIQGTGGLSPFTIEQAPPDQIVHKVYDSSKIEDALNWRPAISLEDGVEKTIEAFRSKEP